MAILSIKRLVENKKQKQKQKKLKHKIYLSVSSEGYGHSSRALAIAREFSRDEIVVGTYSYALERFKNLGYQTTELPLELRLIGSQGIFDVKKTILQNHSWALTFNNIINKEIEAIKTAGATCVVADGRLAPVMAADKLDLPCIVITNQSAFYPFFEKDSALVRMFGKSFDWVMKTWMSSAEEIMIPDFPPPDSVCLYNLSDNHKVKKRTRFVGPLISFDPMDIIEAEKPAEKYIIVTLGGHSYRKPLLDTVIQTAKILPDVHFDLFTSFETSDIPDNCVNKGIVPDLSPYLKAADLVITQAGHSTAMELLTLGKPGIIIPDTKQAEQENNAKRMEEMDVALKIEYSRFSKELLVSSIKKIFSDTKYYNNAKYFAKLTSEIRGSKKTADVLKEYSSRLQYY